ncbi:hypothetical protein J437_LFUL017297 [Ladona fulva]|uniref:MADF domain-containing protein n=1 Tax=Ladona fulva TaxID=123851 RepID=A0A8K0KQQ6_LADFU|nr:hypothetical protein J437_LFUL017297 [Ladona fulva]
MRTGATVELRRPFIDAYRSLPELWDSTCVSYSNHVKKAAAYDVLIEKLKPLEHDATRDSVVKKINNLRSVFRKELKKINNLRSVFRKELKKVNESKKSGASANDVYVPKHTRREFVESEERTEEKSDGTEAKTEGILHTFRSLGPPTDDGVSRVEVTHSEESDHVDPPMGEEEAEHKYANDQEERRDLGISGGADVGDAAQGQRLRFGGVPFLGAVGGRTRAKEGLKKHGGLLYVAEVINPLKI